MLKFARRLSVSLVFSCKELKLPFPEEVTIRITFRILELEVIEAFTLQKKSENFNVGLFEAVSLVTVRFKLNDDVTLYSTGSSGSAKPALFDGCSVQASNTRKVTQRKS